MRALGAILVSAVLALGAVGCALPSDVRAAASQSAEMAAFDAYKKSLAEGASIERATAIAKAAATEAAEVTIGRLADQKLGEALEKHGSGAVDGITKQNYVQTGLEVLLLALVAARTLNTKSRQRSGAAEIAEEVMRKLPKLGGAA